MMHSVGSQPLTPAAVALPGDVEPNAVIEDRGEEEKDQFAHVNARVSTRRGKDEMLDARTRMLSQIAKRQKQLSPTFDAEGNLIDKPVLNADKLVSAGGVRSHFISRVSVGDVLSHDVMHDPFLTLQYVALTGAPTRRVRSPPRTDVPQSGKHHATSSSSSSPKKSPKIFRPFVANNPIEERKVIISTSPTKATLLLRNPAEVPVSQYVHAQIKALRFSLENDMPYHTHFMDHGDDVRRAVTAEQQQKRRAWTFDFLEANKLSVAGATPAVVAHQREKRAALVKQRRAVVDVALTDWFDKMLSDREKSAQLEQAVNAGTSSLHSTGILRTRAIQSTLAEKSETEVEDDAATLRAKRLLIMCVHTAMAKWSFRVLDDFHWQQTKARRARDEAVVQVGGGMSLQQIHRSWATVRRSLRAYIRRYKMRRYAAPTDLVRRFLVHTKRMKTVIAAVGRFRAAVVIAQRQVRRFLIAREARMTLLTLQWVTKECELLGVPHPLQRVKGILRKTQQENLLPMNAFVLGTHPAVQSFYSIRSMTATATISVECLVCDWPVSGGSSLVERRSNIAGSVTELLRKRLKDVQRYEHRKRFFDAQYANFVTLSAKHVDVEPPKEPKAPGRRELFLDDVVLLTYIRRAQAHTVEPQQAMPTAPSLDVSAKSPTDSTSRAGDTVRFREPIALQRDGVSTDESGSALNDPHRVLSGTSQSPRRKHSTAPPTRNTSMAQSKRGTAGGGASSRGTTRMSMSLSTSQHLSPIAKRAMSQSFGPRQNSVWSNDSGDGESLAHSIKSPTRPVPPPQLPKPRSDTFYASLLKQKDAEGLRTFLQHDDRTGKRMANTYAEARRPSKPVTSSLKAVKAQAESRQKQAEEDVFASPMIARKALKVTDANEPVPEGWRQVPLQNVVPTMSSSHLVVLPTPPKTARPSPADAVSTPTRHVILRSTSLTPRGSGGGARLPVVTPAIAGLQKRSTVAPFVERTLNPWGPRPTTVGSAAGGGVSPTASVEQSPTFKFLVDLTTAHDESLRPRIRS